MAAYVIGIEQRKTIGDLAIVGGIRNVMHGITIRIPNVISPSPAQLSAN
jgi:hypothetical protein